MDEIKKILMIDDNPNPTADMLVMWGFDVVVKLNGEDGIKELKTNPLKYDIVLLDIMMPKKDGFDVLSEIREDKYLKDMPVIMLTAIDDDYKQVSYLKHGADDYIVKPFVYPNLLARIEAILRRTSRNKNDIGSAKLLESLTLREKEILRLLSNGNSNAKIAQKLFIREITVKTHLNNIYKKIGVKNRVQAAAFILNIGTKNI